MQRNPMIGLTESYANDMIIQARKSAHVNVLNEDVHFTFQHVQIWHPVTFQLKVELS